MTADPKSRSFRERAARTASGGVSIPFPLDPVETWGRRDRYHVSGTIDGVRFRTSLVHRDGAWQIALGPKSPSGCALEDGQQVAVEVSPEGPQAGQLAADIADALASRPRAQAAFDGLATFYRKGWLRWIDATTRRPDVRAARIAEMVRLVEAGHKQRPA
ncbi:MAG TPA: YdeI/OmpD-associated family protein [Candidatus Dormibacteraeota bacterium]|nr:YdeI/OmpD-associated family protein [Candidatus Dormibacteraeota bacterium]